MWTLHKAVVMPERCPEDRVGLGRAWAHTRGLKRWVPTLPPSSGKYP